ncbi:hypothetical protein acsn021_10490 [Anaerocolumna cellulosilytica]|uniref:Uncharacterized protein n=1 Tax=Anaerocolumna cellulosilytica TaxID=433286 RepID=A0A6S6R2D7_9FIRM|nr:hypothetical protein acsn021_10490 [Anaerocolumna cellulosilytica]
MRIKKLFSYDLIYDIMTGDVKRVLRNRRRQPHETYQDFKYKKFKRYYEKRRMWRMPDFLPVSM